MSNREYVCFIDALFVIASVMVLLPVLQYLVRLWAPRRDNILSYLGKDSLTLYYERFYPDATPVKDSVEEDFTKYFNKRYGRRYYVFPIILLALLTFASAFAISRTLQVWQKAVSDPYSLPWIVVSALAGGFTWVINDLINRLRRRDFSVSDVYNAVFRILVAAPFGWAFAQVVKPDVGVPLAFLLGAFPTKTLFTIARRLAATRLSMSADPDSMALELEQLQSIDKTNAERFYDEGISTIAQLACADPIDLTIRTNFDFKYVIDCISQSLLWIYFEEKTHE